MKKALFFLALIVLFSCEKEAQYCWTCNITTITRFSGGYSSLTTTESKCNMSTRDMELFEQDNNAICTRQ